MYFWSSVNFFQRFSIKATKRIISKAPIVKVRFVREQRIFAKGSRGPLKKRTNTLLKYLKLSINGGKIQNTPPLSTILNLYGINVQKLCDDSTAFLKNNFYEDVPLILKLWISKDLNFNFSIQTVRLNNLLFSLDTRAFVNISYFTSLFNKRSYFNNEVRKYYKDLDNKELVFRDFSIFDLWFFSYFFFCFIFDASKYSIFNNVFAYSIESNIRMFLSQLYTTNNLYRFKKFKYL